VRRTAVESQGHSRLRGHERERLEILGVAELPRRKLSPEHLDNFAPVRCTTFPTIKRRLVILGRPKLIGESERLERIYRQQAFGLSPILPLRSKRSEVSGHQDPAVGPTANHPKVVISASKADFIASGPVEYRYPFGGLN
jgi:hypothetical protein